MKLKEVGEFGLIRKIASLAGKPSEKVIVGLGEDAAIVYIRENKLVATTDSLVDGVHFLFPRISPEELGYKALAVNLSDIAAMGAIPRWSLLSLSLPPEIEEDWLLSLVNSFVESGKSYQVELIGGDLHSSPIITITATVLGVLEGENPLLRSTARPGELIATTGYLGASACGLKIIKGKLNPDEELKNSLIQAHFRPQPKLKEGRVLLDFKVRTAIDISDGLVADLRKICQASHVGAKINADQLPLSPLLSFLPSEQALELALFGGEDYELLFTAPREIMEKLTEKIRIFIIGEITRENVGEVQVVDKWGNLLPKHEGWEHFRAED